MLETERQSDYSDMWKRKGDNLSNSRKNALDLEKMNEIQIINFITNNSYLL